MADVVHKGKNEGLHFDRADFAGNDAYGWITQLKGISE